MKNDIFCIGSGLMEKSIVYVSMSDKNGLGCSYAIIDKGEKSVVIIFKDLECAIYDYDSLMNDNSESKYLLLKHYDDSTLAYKDFMKLIGKMCKKSVEGKYFKNHIEEDNWMIFSDDNNEHMILEEEKNEYLLRKNIFIEFIKNNRIKLIKGEK